MVFPGRIGQQVRSPQGLALAQSCTAWHGPGGRAALLGDGNMAEEKQLVQ